MFFQQAVLEMGLGPNLIQKLAQELRFSLTLINGSSPPSRVAGRHPSQHVQQMGDGGPQLIGPGSNTMLKMGLGPNST